MFSSRIPVPSISAQPPLQICKPRPQLAPLTMPPLRFRPASSSSRKPPLIRSASESARLPATPVSPSSSALSAPTALECQQNEQVFRQALHRNMTPPEQQIEKQLALLNWAATLKQNDEKDGCDCRHFPFQAARSPQAFAGPPLDISHATLLKQFASLKKKLSLYCHKGPAALDTEIRKHLSAIARVTAHLRNGNAEAVHSWTEEDVQTGNHAAMLLNRLENNDHPLLRARPRERPAWRI